jgi:HSP20 family molecular chaperone IbpA
MNRTGIAAIAAFLLFPALALAQDQQPDAEQLGGDMIKNLDGLIGQVTAKLDSDKPVTSADLDSVLNDSFAGSDDPVRDMQEAQKRISAKLGNNKEFNSAYGKWMSRNTSAADLNPEVVSDDDHITVNLKAPKDDGDTMKVSVEGRRIKMDYSRKQTRRETDENGNVTSSSFMQRQHRLMAVPKGADPARYKVRAEHGMVSIIFDRRKGSKRTEASK